MQSKYNHIVVLGNGFDLDLGLPTSYKDFMASEQFQKILSDQNRICRRLVESHTKRNWIDIEKKLKEFSRNTPGDNFEVEYYNICNELIKYISSIDTSIMDKKSMAYTLIKELFDEGEDFLIVDFNYTNTTELILRENCQANFKIHEHHIKIHGSAVNNHIIFGVEDGAQIPSKYIFLKKSCNINYNCLDFNTLLMRANEVTFFGHSLGETDHMYFQEFMTACTQQASRRKRFNLFYYGVDGWYDLHRQLDKLTNNRIGFLKQYNDFYKIDVGPYIELEINI